MESKKVILNFQEHENLIESQQELLKFREELNANPKLIYLYSSIGYYGKTNKLIIGEEAKVEIEKYLNLTLLEENKKQNIEIAELKKSVKYWQALYDNLFYKPWYCMKSVYRIIINYNFL